MLDIDMLIANADDTGGCEKQYDIEALFKNATAPRRRYGLHGEVRVRKLSESELKELRERPVNTYGGSLRYKEPKWYLRPITIKAGVVLRLMDEATDACDFIQRLSQHYGGIFISYKRASEIAYNAYVRHADTDITF